MLAGKTGDRRIGLKETPSEAQTLIDCWGENGDKKGKENRTPQKLWPLHGVWGSGGPQNGDRSGNQENRPSGEAVFAGL